MSRINVNQLSRMTGHDASIFALGASHEPRSLFSAAGDGWLVLWSLDQPELGKLMAKVDTQVFSMWPLPGGRRVVLGNMNGGVHWVDLEHPEATRNIAHHKKGTFAFCMAGDHLYSCGGGGMLTRWDVGEGRSLESLQLTNQSLRSIDYSSGRNELAVGASDNCIYLLDAGTLTVKHKLEQAHANSVFAVRYHPDGRHLCSGGRDAHLRVWDLEDGTREVRSEPAHWYTINDLAFSPDGTYLATASRDKTLKIWSASDFQLLKVLETVRDKGHLNSVNALLWMSDGETLISTGDDRSLIAWKVE